MDMKKHEEGANISLSLKPLKILKIEIVWASVGLDCRIKNISFQPFALCTVYTKSTFSIQKRDYMIRNLQNWNYLQAPNTERIRK